MPPRNSLAACRVGVIPVKPRRPWHLDVRNSTPGLSSTTTKKRKIASCRALVEWKYKGGAFASILPKTAALADVLSGDGHTAVFYFYHTGSRTAHRGLGFPCHARVRPSSLQVVTRLSWRTRPSTARSKPPVPLQRGGCGLSE